MAVNAGQSTSVVPLLQTAGASEPDAVDRRPAVEDEEECSSDDEEDVSGLAVVVAADETHPGPVPLRPVLPLLLLDSVALPWTEDGCCPSVPDA